MIVKRIAAAFLFIAGTAIVAAPIVMRLGWLMPGVGVVLGTSLGVMAGVLWQLAGPLIPTLQYTAAPAVEAPTPPTA